MTTAPHWLVQTYATFDSEQQKQALAWTMDNLNGQELANAYRFARYYRPAMNRQNQFIVDQIGRKVQQQSGGMAGYANYAPAMAGYGMGAYMPTMGAAESGELSDAELAKYYEAEMAKTQAAQSSGGSGDAGAWGALTSIFNTGAGLLKQHMAQQPGSQPNPGGVMPGMWENAAKGWAGAASTAPTAPTTPPPTAPKPATSTATASWVLPVALVAGVGVLAYALMK